LSSPIDYQIVYQFHNTCFLKGLLKYMKGELPHELIDTLTTVKEAVFAGELDAQIEASSVSLRKGFKQ